MSAMPKYAARVDASQEQIVSALRAAGASVYLCRVPTDAIVGFRGVTLLMEFKTPGTYYGKKPNTNQQSFMATWQGGAVATVRDAEAALHAIGAIK